MLSTCLENNLLAANTSSLQVNEGSHLLGPGMLGNETMTGLMERTRELKEVQRERERNQEDDRRSGQMCRYLQDVLLCPIKQEDDSMMKRCRLVGQRMEDFQHHRTAHCIITGT